MATKCHISVRDMQYSYYCDGFKIVATTDIPCHLYMRWSTVTPQKHIVPSFRRGIYMHGDVYFCFVAYKDNEQEEAGDTLTHTFIKRSWTVCETRWFYFWGKVGAEVCPSTTSIFSLHFAIEKRQYLNSLSNRSIQQTNINWDICHDAAAGTIMANYGAPFYLLFAGALLTASYFIYRSFLFFDTSGFPSGKDVAGGWLSLFITEAKRTSSAAYPYVCITRGVQDDPVIPTNYGDQLPYTVIGGQRDLATLIADQYNNIDLTEVGAGFINKYGITKLCIRQEMDIKDKVPPLGTNWIKYHSDQKGMGYRPILTLCYPPNKN